ncbi:hypothetical protein KEH51_10870 [[Brevibacterium] frigoritolerans]|uniref:Uncharacterized protein n=1 Tax=Peribacillus frigoritolerans TaxID=450367 RepID=A0A941FJU9_9BACI|nr:hypothetical protein [Peribacillus frigoritolerans]
MNPSDSSRTIGILTAIYATGQLMDQPLLGFYHHSQMILMLLLLAQQVFVFFWGHFAFKWIHFEINLTFIHPI